MQNKVLWRAVAIMAMSSAIGSEVWAQQATAPTAPKLTEIKVCPFMGEAVANTTKSAIVNQYKVYFCCGGCLSEWAQLSKEDQLKKAEAALKIQQSNTQKTS